MGEAGNDGKEANSMVDQARPISVGESLKYVKLRYQEKSDTEIIALFLLRGPEFLSRLLELDKGVNPFLIDGTVRV